MKKKEVVRMYAFSDAELVTKSKEKIAFFRRDATDLLPFGISEVSVSGLETAVNAFLETHTDVEARGDQTISTQAKDQQKELLLELIRQVMVRAQSKFGFGSAKYDKFGTEALSQQSDAEVLITAKRVVRTGTGFMPDLEPLGLKPAHLTEITTQAEAFSELIVDAKEEIGDRDIMQESRVEEGNSIYAALVNMTTTAQGVWQSKNAAKFNDYIIYNTASGGPDAPPVP